MLPLVDSWRAAIVGIDRIMVVLGEGGKGGAAVLPRGIDDEAVALCNKEIEKKVNFKA